MQRNKSNDGAASGASSGISPLERGSREGETPVHAYNFNLNMRSQRVELLGIAAQSGW